MKKTAIALAMAFSGFAGVASAVPLDNTWNVGVAVSANHLADKSYYSNYPNSDNRHPTQLGAGAQVGYQMTQNVAFRMGSNWLGRFRNEGSNGVDASLKLVEIAFLDLKLVAPFKHDIDAYIFGGAGLMRSEGKKNYVNGFEDKNKKVTATPRAGVGLAYAFGDNKEWEAALEYIFRNNVGSAKKIDIDPDVHSANLTFSYRFGQKQPAPLLTPVVPVVESKRFTLSSEVLFNFDKSDLKPEGRQALDQLYDQLANARGADGQMYVIGYTDRIGSTQYNQRLSERRARAVVNHLVERGIPHDKIIAEGRGESNPVTGSQCDGVKSRNAKIACLAPDRRVEITIDGTQRVETQQTVQPYF